MTEMVASSITLTSASKVPRMESYLSRCAAGLAPPDWFTHTTSRGESAPRDIQQRTKLRPARAEARRRGSAFVVSRPCGSFERGERAMEKNARKKPTPRHARRSSGFATNERYYAENAASMSCRASGRWREGDVPMRPKPLMATFTAASVVVLTAAACAWRWAGRTVSVEDAGERTIRNAGRSCRVQSGRNADATTHLDGLAALEAGGLAAELNL